MEKICCFTGLSSLNLLFSDEKDDRYINLKKLLYNEIVRMITKEGVTHFITDMTPGIDTYAAEIVTQLKKQCAHVKLECVIPFEEQAADWCETDRDRYFDIIENCDREVLLQTKYSNKCMQNCVKYVVDKSDYLIAVWSGENYDSNEKIRYAESAEKEIKLIKPDKMSVTVRKCS